MALRHYHVGISTLRVRIRGSIEAGVLVIAIVLRRAWLVRLGPFALVRVLSLR